MDVSRRVEKAKDVRSRTIVLNLDPKGKPFNRYEVAQALLATQTVKADQIVCLGPLSRNAEWYITLSKLEFKQALLTYGPVSVRNYNGSFKPASSDEFKLRVHWLPPWIDNDCLYNALNKYDMEVISTSTDRSTVRCDLGNLENTQITARTVMVKTTNKSNIPHVIEVEDIAFGDTYKALITMTGRAPLCLRCKMEGHIRARCDTPFCTKCKIFGHRLINCPGQAGYAGAVRSGDKEDDADMDQSQIEMSEKSSDDEGTLHIVLSSDRRKRGNNDEEEINCCFFRKNTDAVRSKKD
jgi:hypothetical protein